MKVVRIVCCAALVLALILAASFIGYAYALVADDAFEVDSAAAPRVISDAQLPLVEPRTIHAADFAGSNVDWDYYELVGTAGTLYTFETSGTADTILRIRDAATGEALAWYDDKSGGDRGSKGYWRCPSAGAKVYVWIGPANSETGVGAYTMSITGLPASARIGTTVRAYGANRYAAAVNVARWAYRATNGSPWHYVTDGTTKNVSHVIVTSGDAAASISPMIAQPMAAIYHAPVLLVSRDALPTATKDAIRAIRLNNGGSVSIHVIGGSSWVSSSVYTQLKALRGSAGAIERISGVDRYALAAKIADRVDTAWVRNMGQHASSVVVANGSDTAALTDLLSASGIAYRMGWPILLTRATIVPAPTYSRVKTGAFKQSRVIVANSAAFVNAETYAKASGDLRLSSHGNRYSSALDIARRGVLYYWLNHNDVVVVNRVSEALTVGTYAGKNGSVVLVSGTSSPSVATYSYLVARPSMVDRVRVVGSSGAISDSGIAAHGRLLR